MVIKSAFLLWSCCCLEKVKIWDWTFKWWRICGHTIFLKCVLFICLFRIFSFLSCSSLKKILFLKLEAWNWKLEILNLKLWKLKHWNFGTWNFGLKFGTWNLRFWNFATWDFENWNLIFWKFEILKIRILNLGMKNLN